MHKLVIVNLFVLNVIFMINAESRTVYPEDATDDDVDSLRSITFGESLPITLFKTKNENALQHPQGLTKAEINDKRLVFGTEFYNTSSPSGQIFFCPNSNEEMKCLVPTLFKEADVLECEHGPVPILQEHGIKKNCGVREVGTWLKFAYNLCPSDESYMHITSKVAIFNICYHQSSKKVLYVDHQIFSVNLLNEKLLTRERGVEFQFSKEMQQHIDEEYYKLLDDAANQFEANYRFQKLVPSENMAFATFIKPTYHYINLALQHKSLFDLWNKINELIKSHAIDAYSESPFNIMTGVFDIPEDKINFPKDENQIFNMWITIISDENNSKGLAILMHNFIIADKTANQTKQYIDQLCGTNLCADAMKQSFTNAKVQGRCCNVNRRIMKLFIKEQYIVEIRDVLRILHVNEYRPPV